MMGERIFFMAREKEDREENGERKREGDKERRKDRN